LVGTLSVISLLQPPQMQKQSGKTAWTTIAMLSFGQPAVWQVTVISWYSLMVLNLLL
jgi:hypothetical protein